MEGVSPVTEPVADKGLARHLVRLPQRQVLAEDVYEAVKALIMDHAIEPGARLNIDALARELQVSQTPIRETLARLESEGLVTKAALRGYSVAPLLTHKELEDLFGLRDLIEPWAAATAATRADAAAIGALEAELSSLTEIPEGSQYDVYKAIAAHDNRFHDLVFATAGNDAVRAAFERTHCHLHLFRLYYAGGIAGQAMREHRRIVDAIASGDRKASEAAMRAHLKASLARLRKAFT
jgi:DNA-binding GntR family transcriptional regulator